ncbi:dephospho-CoA kinase [Cytobacillus sp. FSL W7-1323]|uniref:Dephospho-CoA kinase n=1 Tax=Cytobacillus kochii TaxID=859143 RepID=A0A248TKY1_9BACI|nr:MULTISPECIES: dephospho-CoA kinase [Cytobacillus]ASV68750.1 dephospho-CoA kinase [Cytobacillus kochii]MDQ0183452.1 dephospho-CoA kinase [Cytobacillus kochii]MEA1853368.1 dephospho-CoA kinase [Cytobacillus sp. OWB-43]MED1603965.1 dephospho-CoA kinase [Cytobacillus kochii]
MTVIIGLTGGIASGKSTVSTMFKERAITVIDADVEAKRAVEKGAAAYDEIVSHFGQEILLENGEINRQRLGSIVFYSEEERMKLNSIVHPAVRKRMNEQKDEAVANGEKMVVLDIPLLFESKLTYMVDYTVLVYVNKENQLQRLMERNGFDAEEANARIRSQMLLEEKVQLADFLIDNNGDLASTEKQLDDLLLQLKDKQ